MLIKYCGACGTIGGHAASGKAVSEDRAKFFRIGLACKGPAHSGTIKTGGTPVSLGIDTKAAGSLPTEGIFRRNFSAAFIYLLSHNEDISGLCTDTVNASHYKARPGYPGHLPEHFCNSGGGTGAVNTNEPCQFTSFGACGLQERRPWKPAG